MKLDKEALMKKIAKKAEKLKIMELEFNETKA